MARLFFSSILISTVFLYCRGQAEFDCPVGWASFEDLMMCYQFVFYPTLPYDEASQACHQDGASLVSVRSGAEHTFIANWLSSYSGSRLSQWYTSGVMIKGDRIWKGDGDSSLAGEENYWVIDPATETQVAQSFSEAHLVYQFSEKDNRFGWAWTGRTGALPYICEIPRSEVYRVIQKDRGFEYGNPSSDPNDWLVGPRFVHQSPSTVFVAGDRRIHIECSAEGNPSPTYQWIKDYRGENHQQIFASDRYTVTNGRLTIAKPREGEDAGSYTCVAQNPAGQVFSSPILVSKGRLEEFSNDKPGSRTAVLYQGAVLDCSPPAFNPVVVVQWMKDNQFIRPEMNPHTFLSENGKLYFSEVQAADAAEYRCIVTLVAPPGAVMATPQAQQRYSRGIPFKIRVEDANEFGPDVHDDFPAMFPKQPLRGQEMRLECLAYGRIPIAYKWSRVDGGKLPEDRISYGSLNRVLRIRDAQIQDSGVYMCTVKGTVNVDSKNISVTVSAVPYFKFPLRNQHLDAGSRLTWVCDAVAIPRATYAWYKNGQLLVTDPDQDIQVVKNVLTIGSADSAKHDGMYECVAWNDLGTNTSTAQIRVLSFKPNFNKSPVRESMMGTEGGNVTMTCHPEAAPQAVITWSRDGTPIISSDRYKILANGNLVLSGLSVGDAGLFTCIAENAMGKAESSGRLAVHRKTTLSTRPRATSVSQNSSAHLECEASFNVNETDLVYAWYFNGHLLDTDIELSYTVERQGGIQGLYIIGAQFEHEGWYECRAVTVFDRESAQAYLTVLGPPGEPAGVHVKRAVGTEVTLWWQQAQTHGDPVTQYSVEFHSEYDSTWRVLNANIQAYNTQVPDYINWHQYVIEANILSPGTTYWFRVSAASANYGFGPPSKLKPSDKPVTLQEAAPIYPVEAVSGGGGQVGMLRVKWLPLPPERHGGKGVYYKVFYRKHRLPDDMWFPSNRIYGNKPDRDGFVWFHKWIGEENFYTEFDVKVQVFNDKGPGPNTTVTTVMSAEDIPITTPQNVNANGLNATAGIVTWELPNNTREGMRGKVLGYQINWWHWGGRGENCDGFEDREIIRFIRHYGTDMEGVVIGLFANDDYWVNVQVFNSAGLSRPSGCNYMNTNYEAPLHYPEYIRVTSNGPESVRVSWRGVSTLQVESPVSGYKVWYWPYTEDIRTAKVATFPKLFTGLLHGIKSDIIYKLRVLGTSDGGDGKKSPPTFFTLGGQVPFDPRTSEILASAALLKPSLGILVCLSVVPLLL